MTIRSEARLQQSLDEVTRLLDKHRVLETLAQTLAIMIRALAEDRTRS